MKTPACLAIVFLPLAIGFSPAAMGQGAESDAKDKSGAKAKPAGKTAPTPASKVDHDQVRAALKALGVGTQLREQTIKVYKRDLVKWGGLVQKYCGVDVGFHVDYAAFINNAGKAKKVPDVPQAAYSCIGAFEGMMNACSEGDAYKAAFAEQVKSVSCWYDNSEEFRKTSRASFSLKDGVLKIGFGRIPAGIGSTTQKFLKKKL